MPLKTPQRRVGDTIRTPSTGNSNPRTYKGREVRNCDEIRAQTRERVRRLRERRKRREEQLEAQQEDANNVSSEDERPPRERPLLLLRPESPEGQEGKHSGSEPLFFRC